MGDISFPPVSRDRCLAVVIARGDREVFARRLEARLGTHDGITASWASSGRTNWPGGRGIWHGNGVGEQNNSGSAGWTSDRADHSLDHVYVAVGSQFSSSGTCGPRARSRRWRWGGAAGWIALALGAGSDGHSRFGAVDGPGMVARLFTPEPEILAVGSHSCSASPLSFSSSTDFKW